MGDRRGGGAGPGWLPGSAAPRAAGTVSSPPPPPCLSSPRRPGGGRSVRPAGSPALPAAHPPGAGGEPPLGRRCPGCRYFPPPLRAAAPSRRRRRRGDKSGQRRQNACFAAGVGTAGLGTTRCSAVPRLRGHGGRPGEQGRRGRRRGAGSRGARRRCPGIGFVPLSAARCRSPGRRVVAEYLFQRVYF